MIIDNTKDYAKLLLKYYIYDLRDDSKNLVVRNAKEAFYNTILLFHKDDIDKFLQNVATHFPELTDAHFPKTHDKIMDMLMDRETRYRGV